MFGQNCEGKFKTFYSTLVVFTLISFSLLIMFRKSFEAQNVQVKDISNNNTSNTSINNIKANLSDSNGNSNSNNGNSNSNNINNNSNNINNIDTNNKDTIVNKRS